MNSVRAEDTKVREVRVTVEGAPARVHVGGAGPALLLVHGGWGGAAMHWSAVWDRLAEDFRVIAPDLPGIGWTEQPALASVRSYAHWLASLLDALDVGAAWCVGNSFGASVAWRFAALNPARCAGVVLVNGFPMPRTPGPLRWLGRRSLGQELMRARLRRIAYRPGALDLGFADPARAPDALREVLHRRDPPQMEAMVQNLIQGDGGAAPVVAPLLLWGAADRLPGSDARAAHRLHAALTGSTLTLVPLAGHLPQAERPVVFVEALEAFIRSHPPVAAA